MRDAAHAMPICPQDNEPLPGDDQQGRAQASGTQEDAKDEAIRPRVVEQEIQAPEEEEDAQHQRSLRVPDMPTKEELADHRANGHLPYRCWCPDCVEAFGRERAHGHSEGRSIPLVSCDYLFVTPRGVFRKAELTNEEQEEALKVLVAYCSATRSIFAHAVPKKGLDEKGYIVDQLKQDILWLGHSLVVIKGDNEPALIQVISATLAALKMSGVTSVSDEGSVPYDPQTNGAAAAAVRLLKGTLKANLLGLERQINARVPVDHPIVAWMVRYSATVRTLRVKGPDGNTA